MRMSLTFASQELHSPLQTITIFRNLNYLQHPYKHLTPERVHILLPVTEIDAVAITKKLALHTSPTQPVQRRLQGPIRQLRLLQSI